MATLADSLVSSSSRKLPIRKRPDLDARRQRYQGRNYWVVKDPVGLQYYRFEEEEYAILQMLDGESSLDEIADRFEREFPPQTIRTEELQQFIGMLHRSGLVITDAAGQGQQLVKRRAEKTKQERLATLANILSLRFKGVDPERFFNFIYPYIRWFFSVTAMCVCITIGLAALTLILVQFDVFHSRLPDFHSFFKAKNWLWLGLTLCVTKILHEFGHGLSCKHFGGECHEIGIMFLVLTPCLYCNVSDSWMLPNRWHRAAIGAAGMYVELVLASICTFIWWFTSPTSPISYICLNVMFISSVSTLMFNANPLLRYDGYYILSDVLEIPNLRQKASTILNRKLGAWCLGLEEPEDPFLPQRKQWLFATYTVASAIYRWVVTFSILYFLNRVFQPYGLKVLGQAIALGSIYGLIGQPLWSMYKFFKVPGRLGDVKRARLYATLVLIVSAIVGIGLIPFPSHVYAPLEIRARQADADWVYAEVDGILEEVRVHPGQQVKKGDLLARLRNIDTEISIAELTGQKNVFATQLEGLKYASFDDHRAASQIDPITKALRGTEKQLVQRHIDLEKLNLVAPRDGTVLPAPIVEKHGDEATRLPTWYGSPFDPENLGARLVTGTVFCQVGDPKKMEAGLVIDQNDVEFVLPGQKVEILLDQTADYVYTNCEIEQVSTEDLKKASPHLSSLHGGPLASKMDGGGVARPMNTIFEAIVPLPEEDPHNLLRLGLIGKAKITTAPRTLFSRIYRYAAHTFNFEL